jgi:hypothetical protein
MNDNQLDYWTMLFQLAAGTNYNEGYLLSLNEKEIERIYKEKILNQRSK